MKAIEIITLAFKAEAKAKPDEYIYVGRRKLTYAELSVMIEGYPKINNNFLNSFLEQAEQMFNDNPVFQKKMKTLAGIA